MSIHAIEGNSIKPRGKYALVVARFNSFVVDHLVDGAIATLIRSGVDPKDIRVIKVPGAFEIPLVAQKIAKSKKYSSIIALGAIIRGSTPHFEYVCGECVKGLSTVSITFDIPIIFGVLTVNSIEQAIERSGSKAGNKGSEAASSAIEMVSLLDQLEAE